MWVWSCREGGSFEDSMMRSMSSISWSCGGTVEPVKMELPALGSEFRGREEFLDEVIATLNELQKVRETSHSKVSHTDRHQA